MVSKTLFLFLFSPNPDSYINAICYSYEKLGVRKVKLIHVKGVRTALSDKEAPLVKNRIWNQIESLSKGEYIQFPKEPSDPDEPRKRQLTHIARSDIYRRIQEDFLDDGMVDVQYATLKEDLNRIFRKYGGNNPQDYVIDLTSGAKVPAIDIFLVCLALKIDQLYVFELTDSVDRTNPENFLYHALTTDKFSYTCLTKSPAVIAGRAAFLRKGNLKWGVMFVSLVVLAVSIVFFFNYGSESLPLQFVMTLSGIIGLITPLYSYFSERGI